MSSPTACISSKLPLSSKKARLTNCPQRMMPPAAIIRFSMVTTGLLGDKEFNFSLIKGISSGHAFERISFERNWRKNSWLAMHLTHRSRASSQPGDRLAPKWSLPAADTWRTCSKRPQPRTCSSLEEDPRAGWALLPAWSDHPVAGGFEPEARLLERVPLRHDR